MTGFASSPQPPAPPKAPGTAPTGTVTGCTGPAPIDLRAGTVSISAEERAKRFEDGWCQGCGGFNHREAECTARKNAQTFKAAEAEKNELGSRKHFKESGKEVVNHRTMALQLPKKVLF